MIHRASNKPAVLVHTHCTGTGLGTIDFYIMLCTVHTTLRLGTGPEPIASYCANPIPVPVPFPFPCSVTKP